MSSRSSGRVDVLLNTSKRAIAVAAVALLSGLVLSVPTASARPADGPATTPPSSIQQLQQSLDLLVTDGAPGALLYTYDGGGVTELQSGIADLEAGTPVGPESRYRIGSATKTYVATAVLQLVAQNRIDLDSPARRYLPRLLASIPDVTVRQLLNHTSGLYEFNDDPRVLTPYLEGHLGHVWTPRRLVRIALSHEVVARPGTAWHYANTNYVLAGLIVQAVTGQPLGKVLHDHVLAPAHLTATTFSRSRTLPAPATHGYFMFPGDDEPTDITSLYPYPWASGSAVATAPDVAQFFRHLLSGQLLPQRMTTAMQTTVDSSKEEGPGTRYGLGIQRFDTPCGTAWGHGGNFAGYLTWIYSSPSGSRQTALMINMDPSVMLPKTERHFFGLMNQAYCGVDTAGRS